MVKYNPSTIIKIFRNKSFPDFSVSKIGTTLSQIIHFAK